LTMAADAAIAKSVRALVQALDDQYEPDVYCVLAGLPVDDVAVIERAALVLLNAATQAREASKAYSPEVSKAYSPEVSKAYSPEVSKAYSPEVSKAYSPEVSKAYSPEVPHRK